MDFFALVITGFCPVIDFSSSVATSRILALLLASPRPMLTTIFSILGTAIGFLMSNSFARDPATSFLYFSLNLAIARVSPKSLFGSRGHAFPNQKTLFVFLLFFVFFLCFFFVRTAVGNHFSTRRDADLFTVSNFVLNSGWFSRIRVDQSYV